MMLRHLGWKEAADRVIKGMDGAIASKRVTYDFARLMEGATEIKCSAFGGQHHRAHVTRAARERARAKEHGGSVLPSAPWSSNDRMTAKKNSDRQSVLERSATAGGEQWARRWRDELASSQRRAAGGWPGTIAQARVCARAHLSAELARLRLAGPEPRRARASRAGHVCPCPRRMARSWPTARNDGTSPALSERGPYLEEGRG